MRTSNFALRLQPTLMEEARALAKAEGVALNQLINTAVAEKLAATRTLRFFERYTQGANVEEGLSLLRRSKGDESPRKGDELPKSWKHNRLKRRGQKQAKNTIRNKSRS